MQSRQPGSRRGSRSDHPVDEQLRGLLAERGLSLRELGRRVGVDPTFLSRALRGARSKSVSGRLAGRIAEALNLPVDYFPEYRRDYVVERLEADQRLMNETYARLRRQEKQQPKPSLSRRSK